MTATDAVAGLIPLVIVTGLAVKTTEAVFPDEKNKKKRKGMGLFSKK